jgi:hypothetical protein
MASSEWRIGSMALKSIRYSLLAIRHLATNRE